jgi:hypothetical protein
MLMTAACVPERPRQHATNASKAMANVGGELAWLSLGAAASPLVRWWLLIRRVID